MKKTIIGLLLIFTAYTAVFRAEYAKGVCLNEERDGYVINAAPGYEYISYNSTNAEPGDTVYTLLILNPFTTYFDDYIYRHDWIRR